MALTYIGAQPTVKSREIINKGQRLTIHNMPVVLNLLV